MPTRPFATSSRAYPRSSMVVIFRLRLSPSTMRTGSPAARTAAASSPKDRSATATRALSRMSRRNTCGVCADHRPSRDTSSIATPASSARRTVSASGNPATAVPSVRAISTQRAKSDGGTTGRAESWIAITSASGAAASAAQLDCVLVSPPATTLASGARERTIASMGPRGTSGRTTTTIRVNAPDAIADASDHARTGWPPRSAVILSVPARVELPAARIAQTAPVLAIDGTRSARFGDLTLRMAEDHPATDRLKDAHNGDRELGADVPGAVLDDDHRSVLQITHGLRGLLPFQDHAHRDLLSGQDDRTNGFREIVHVEHGDALKLRHAIEAVIVGHDRHAEALRERDELPVGAVPRGILFRQLDLDGLLFLHLREHLQTAATALAPRAVRGVVEILKLRQHELGDDERSPDEAAPDDVSDAAVDDDRRVEEDARVGRAALAHAAYALRERAQLV